MLSNQPASAVPSASHARGIKIDLKITRGEMAPPPWAPNSYPSPSPAACCGITQRRGCLAPAPRDLFSPEDTNFCPFPHLSAHAKASVPVAITHPISYTEWRRQRCSSSHHQFPCFQPNPIPKTPLRLSAGPVPGPCGGLPAGLGPLAGLAVVCPSRLQNMPVDFGYSVKAGPRLPPGFRLVVWARGARTLSKGPAAPQPH